MNNSDYSPTPQILLGVTGGIAAYKSAELCRLLVKKGYQVQVVMTAGANQFINELTFQSLTGLPVRQALFDPAHEAAMGHIELARWAALIVVAPASADFIAKLHAGMADTLLHTLCLATKSPVVIAPAMNQQMWMNSATQANIAGLQQRDIQVWGPASGDQACGDIGPGRMLEATELAQNISAYFSEAKSQHFVGRKVLVTAGPTYEPIDPVRFIGNRSSGKMGFAIVQALLEEGAEVILVAGPVNLTVPQGCQCINVQTAQEMHQAAMQYAQEVDIFVSCAAVADYRPEITQKNKIKKDRDGLQISLVKNPDILQSVANLSKSPFCLGFAAETQNLEEYAETKRKKKNIDMIAANYVGQSKGFDSNDNALLVLWDQGRAFLPEQPKAELAKQLIELLAKQFHANTTDENPG